MFYDFHIGFGGVLLSEIRLQELLDTALDGQLDISELFIHFVAKDFAEQLDFVVFILVGLDCLNNRSSLVNYNAFKPVFLREVSLEILLHSFATLLVLVDAFVVMLNF